MKLKRLFVAIFPDESQHSQLLTLQNALAENLLKTSKKLSPSHWHVTLWFMSQAQEEKIPKLIERLQHAVSAQEAGDLILDAPMGFAQNSAATAIGIGTHSPPSFLSLLHGRLKEVAKDLGLPWEERALLPHLTLIRDRTPQQVPSIPVTWTLPVKEVVLVESELAPQGSRYTRLATMRFAVR